MTTFRGPRARKAIATCPGCRAGRLPIGTFDLVDAQELAIEQPITKAADARWPSNSAILVFSASSVAP